CRLPAKGRVQGHDILVAEIEPVEGPDDIAIPFAEPARDAGRGGFCQRDIERGEALVEIVAADPHPRAAGQLADLRFARADQDRAANRVATEQRALRSAQNLDARDIAEFQRPANRAPDIDFVDIDADARIDGGCGIELPDAADEHDGSRRVAGKLAGRLELQTR